MYLLLHRQYSWVALKARWPDQIPSVCQMITRSEMDFTYLLCKVSQVFEITRGTALFSCETTAKLFFFWGGRVS